ncbi:hypothetical protein V8E54_001661 [Elaphomyces granulatus]
MFEDTYCNAGDLRRQCSLPNRTLSSACPKNVDKTDDQRYRRLPPLPQVDPLPPGPFNHIPSYVCSSSPTSLQDSFPAKSSWQPSENVVSTTSLASTVDESLRESFAAQKAFGWPDISAAEIMSLAAPKNAHRKPPLQQVCERKRNRSVAFGEFGEQRERHRIAEGNRRKNLSQLHRELDNRVHDLFLERAGWNPAKNLPQSKEQIVQGAIFLIDFMILIVTHLLEQEKQAISPQLSGKLRSYLGCIHLQLAHQQNRMGTVRQDNDVPVEPNRTKRPQLKSFAHIFPKNETIGLQTSQQKLLPGLSGFCDKVVAVGAETLNSSSDLLQIGSSQTLPLENRFLRSGPPRASPSQ